MTAPGDEERCGSHASLGTELRAVAVLLLDRLAPALEALRSGDARGREGQAGDVCASCPVCAVLALLRGERPELAVRLAEHASALLDLLSSALQEPEPEARPEPSRARRVQRIPVERPAAG